MDELHRLEVGERAFVVLEDGEVLGILSDCRKARDLADEEPDKRLVVELEISGFYP